MKASTFLIMFGFLLTFGAVGGIEHSQDDWSLLAATGLAFVGLSCAWCGVLMQKVQSLDYYKRTANNPTLW